MPGQGVHESTADKRPDDLGDYAHDSEEPHPFAALIGGEDIADDRRDEGE